MPSLSVTVVRVRPVSFWVAVTVAPGSGRPLLSWTLPMRLPPEVWRVRGRQQGEAPGQREQGRDREAADRRQLSYGS